jgi:hypothetical protein
VIDETPNYPNLDPEAKRVEFNRQLIWWGSTEGKLILDDDGMTVLGVELTHKEFHGPEEN